MAKSKMMLNAAIRQRLAELKRTQEWFAEQSRMSANVLRVQLSRNIYSDTTLKAAAELLCDGSKSELSNLYEFQETVRKRESTVAPTQSLKERVGRTIRPPQSGLTQDIYRLYSMLGASDLVVICTLDLPPLECTSLGWPKLKDALTKAVVAGSNFVYIRPNSAAVAQHSQMLPEFFNKRTPSQEYKELQKNLLESIGSKNDARKNVMNNVKLLEVEWCPFWSIGTRFGFYSVLNEEKQTRDLTLFARFPFGGHPAGEESVDSNLLLYSDERTREAFQTYLIRQFDNKRELRHLSGYLI
jgi:hypothetical protein